MRGKEREGKREDREREGKEEEEREDGERGFGLICITTNCQEIPSLLLSCPYTADQ